MLMSACNAKNLVDLGRRDFAGVGAAHAHAFAVDLQHYLSRLLAVHRKHSLQHDDHKVHRREFVGQQQNL